MERLTETGKVFTFPKTDLAENAYLERVQKRLAAYEDTGLEPEDIKKAFNEEAVLKLAAQALGTTPERLWELVKSRNEAEAALGGGGDG